MPDLEKKISRLYKYSIIQENCPIYFENMNIKKLIELKEVLDSLKQVHSFLKEIAKHRETLKSERLIALTGFKNKDDGLLPEFSELLTTFEHIIDWKKLGKGKANEQVPEPNGGVDEAYDKATETIHEIEKQLLQQLEHWQNLFSDKKIAFAHKKYVISFLFIL